MPELGLEQPLVVHRLVLQRYSSRRRVLERDACGCFFAGISETPEATSRVTITSPLETAHRVSVASCETSSVLPAAEC